ncbi:MAG TPA: hypothetical protein PLS73_09780 [Saprospiraceae bacterium]|nr:hypothetical protein [Saprospiraceae bacterium]
MSTPVAHSKALQKISVKALEYLLKLLGSILVFVFLFIVFLKAEFVQDWSRNWIVDYLKERYNQEIQINSFYLDPFNGFKGSFLIKDHHQDTLFYTQNIQLGFMKSIRSLLSRKLFLDNVECDSVLVKLKYYEGESNSNLNVFISKFSDPNSKVKTPFQLNFNHVVFKNSKFSYLDSKQFLHLAFNKLDLLVDSLNYDIQYFSIRKILLDNPIVNYNKFSDSLNTNLVKPIATKDSCKNMPCVYIRFFNINNGYLSYIDPIHTSANGLEFTNVNLTSKNIFHGEELDQIEFLHTNLKSSDNFAIKNAALRNFKLSRDQLITDDFLLETLLSSMRFKLNSNLSYSEADHKLDLKNSFIQLQLLKGQFDLFDFDKLFPKFNLLKNLNLKNGSSFNLTGKLFGRLNNLKGSNILFKYSDQFNFAGNLGSRNLFNKDKLILNLKIDQLLTSASFLRKLFNRYNIPESYDRFGKIKMNGQFDGYLNDFVAYGSFNTELGTIRSDIKVNLSTNQNQDAMYSGGINTFNLDLGRLLQKENFGILNSEIKIINGKGLSSNNFSANIDGSIKEFVYKEYHYSGISINGFFNKSILQGELKIQDINADVVLKGSYNRLDDKGLFKIDGDIKKLNLHALNLTKDTASYSGNMSMNLGILNGKNATGSLEILNSSILINSEKVYLNKFLFTSSDKGDKSKLSILSDFADIEFTGQFELNNVVNDLKGLLVSKYPILDSVIHYKKSIHASSLIGKGSVYIKDSKSLAKLFNWPLEMNYSDFDISLNNNKNEFELRSNRFDLTYKAFKFDKFSLVVNSSDNLNAIFTADYFLINGVRRAGNFRCVGNLVDSIGKLSLLLFDTLNVKILSNINTNINYNKDLFSIHILNKDLFFNNSRWVINDNNYIQKSKNGLFVKNFELSDSLHFFSLRDIEGKGLVLKSDGFDISFVNQFIRNKTISFSGLFAANIEIPNYKNLKGLNGNFDFFQLHFNKDNFGPFNLSFDVPDIMKPWNVKVENVFQEHRISGTGSINIPIIKKNYQYNPFDFSIDLSIKAFPFKFLENFVSSISKSTGGADGNLKFYGVKGNLFLTGQLNAAQGSTFINYLGVPVLFENQPIVFKENEIIFNNIEILDKFRNPIKLDGKLTHNYFKTFAAYVKLLAPKALILDTKKGENIYYYGYGIGSIDVSFNGPFSAMDMDAKITSLKGTKFNIPVTYDQTATDSRFVRFSSSAQTTDSVVKPVIPSIIGLNMNMQLTITEDADISIIFDELAGDILRGTGRGNLSITSLRTGLFKVNGLYEVEQGQYLFTLYNFVNKPFAIARGGTINWTGDPLNANIQLEAVYEGLSTSPYILIQEYLGTDQRLIEEAKRRTDVKLKMLLTGSLLFPDIKFDIDMPDLTGQLKNFSDNKIRYLRTNQDQLNQQVFGLLVLRTFLNSFDPTEIGSNLSTTTINTMSEMLSNQFSLFVTSLLSNAFDDVNFISGVDFNVGYDFDNTIPGTSKFNEGEVVFSLKHRLWNDQWIVTLGGNYKSSSSSIYGNSYFNPESIIEWNTPVPGLKLRIYYRGDESIEGLKHKIGTGISYRKEFDSFFDFKKALDSKAKSTKKNSIE